MTRPTPNAEPAQVDLLTGLRLAVVEGGGGGGGVSIARPKFYSSAKVARSAEPRRAAPLRPLPAVALGHGTARHATARRGGTVTAQPWPEATYASRDVTAAGSHPDYISHLTPAALL